MNNVYIYIFLFISAFLLSYFINRFFLKKSYSHILKKANISGIRWASQQKPLSGGITFYSIFLLTIIIYFLFFDFEIISNNKFIGIFLVVTISFFMGLADDIISTSPYFKFFIQLLSAIILINSGVCIYISSYAFFNYALTIFWVVAIMNSFNILDNMDAITALISVSIIIGIILNIALSGLPAERMNPLILQAGNTDTIFLLFLSIGIIATLCSFLLFNWHPSKIYMGDNGSQFLGAFLASLGIIYFWNSDLPAERMNPFILQAGQITINNNYFEISKQLLPAILAFLVPIVDTTSVVINRIIKKQSPFIGGKDHTTHHLAYLGLSDRQVALTLFILSLVSVLLSVYIVNFIPHWEQFHIYSFTAFALLIFIVLYTITKISKQKL